MSTVYILIITVYPDLLFGLDFTIIFDYVIDVSNNETSSVVDRPDHTRLTIALEPI